MSSEELELAQFRLEAANNAMTTARRLGDVARMEKIQQEISDIKLEIERIQAQGT